MPTNADLAYWAIVVLFTLGHLLFFAAIVCAIGLSLRAVAQLFRRPEPEAEAETTTDDPVGGR